MRDGGCKTNFLCRTGYFIQFWGKRYFCLLASHPYEGRELVNMIFLWRSDHFIQFLTFFCKLTPSNPTWRGVGNMTSVQIWTFHTIAAKKLILKLTIPWGGGLANITCMYRACHWGLSCPTPYAVGVAKHGFSV